MQSTAPSRHIAASLEALVALVGDVAHSSGQQWRSEGLCLSADADVFYPERGVGPARAKVICERCPVQAKCLNDALARREPHGIWGAATASERRAILARRRRHT